MGVAGLKPPFPLLFSLPSWSPVVEVEGVRERSRLQLPSYCVTGGAGCHPSGEVGPHLSPQRPPSLSL